MASSLNMNTFHDYSCWEQYASVYWLYHINSFINLSLVTSWVLHFRKMEYLLLFTLHNRRSFIKFLELMISRSAYSDLQFFFWILRESIFSQNISFTFRLMVFWSFCEVSCLIALIIFRMIHDIFRLLHVLFR